MDKKTDVGRAIRIVSNAFCMANWCYKRTLENWEQGRRHPTGPARALLRLLDKDPEYALRTLHG